MSDHDRYINDVGAWLLGALEDDEVRGFEDHLAGCATCREELERLRPAAEALPRSVEPVLPPDGLRASLMETVEAEARSAEPRRRSLRERMSWLLRPRPAVAWGAVCFVLVVGAVAGWGVAAIVSESSGRTVQAEVGEQMPQASGNLRVFKGEDGAILRLHGMPSPGPGRVYQAWVVRDGEVVPEPTFEVSRDGSATAPVTEDLEDADEVLVTRERRGGAAAPSERPIVSVKL